MFHHVAYLPSQFCQIPVRPSRIGQIVKQKKNSQPRSQTRWLIHKHCLVKSPLDARDKKVSQRAQKSLRLATKCLNSETYGGAGYRSRYLSHAKRALYHLSYAPELRILVKC